MRHFIGCLFSGLYEPATKLLDELFRKWHLFLYDRIVYYKKVFKEVILGEKSGI